MDYTQMRFKDLLVSDLGSLPPDAHINEELYNLLTLPYTLGSDMNTRLTTHKYHGDSGTYQIGMTLSKGSAEAKLVTDIRVTDGKAEQSIIAVGRYATHEEYPEGCLTIQTTRQPFKSHSAKSESDLCGVVMDHILYELHMINEDMLSDVSPNRKEYNI